MPGIFINYRSDDVTFAAPLVDVRLRERFGDGNVFLDSRSLEAATDFPPELWRRLKQSSVLVVLIGPRWLMVRDESGNRRIDDRTDYVRREIRKALKRHIPVLPVLVNGAELPSAKQLPADITAVRDFQFVLLRLWHAETDLDLLADALAQMVPAVPGGGNRKGRAAPHSPSGQSSLHITARDPRFEGPVAGGNAYGSRS